MNTSISAGCIIASAMLRRSLLFQGVRIGARARLDGAVVLPEAQIGRDARLTKVVVNHGVHVPDGLVVGEDEQRDAQRFRRTERGVCLITQPMINPIADRA